MCDRLCEEGGVRWQFRLGLEVGRQSVGNKAAQGRESDLPRVPAPGGKLTLRHPDRNRVRTRFAAQGDRQPAAIRKSLAALCQRQGEQGSRPFLPAAVAVNDRSDGGVTGTTGQLALQLIKQDGGDADGGGGEGKSCHDGVSEALLKVFG